MRTAILVVILLIAAVPGKAASDSYTVENITKAAASATGGKKQVMVLLLKKDDLPKGDFQRVTAFCRQKKLAMAIGGPDADLIHLFLNRELALAGKRRTKGLTIVVVGAKAEDVRLRPLLEEYGIHYIYTACPDDEKKGQAGARANGGAHL